MAEAMTGGQARVIKISTTTNGTLRKLPTAANVAYRLIIMVAI